MKTAIFNLIDAVNREGIDNSVWGLCRDVQDTAAYFGAVESIKLQGQYLYVYRNHDSNFTFITKETCGHPAHTLTIEDGAIDLYTL